MTRTFELAAAVFLTRTMLGFVYFFGGIQRLSVNWPMAAVEIVLGAMLIAGFWSRPALRCLAVMIVGATIFAGIQGLRDPMGPTAMNIQVVNFYILPRAALIIVNLFLPAEDDRFSVDELVRRYSV